MQDVGNVYQSPLFSVLRLNGYHPPFLAVMLHCRHKVQLWVRSGNVGANGINLIEALPDVRSISLWGVSLSKKILVPILHHTSLEGLGYCVNSWPMIESQVIRVLLKSYWPIHNKDNRSTITPWYVRARQASLPSKRCKQVETFYFAWNLIWTNLNLFEIKSNFSIYI